MCGSHWHFLQAMYGGCHRLPSAGQQGGRTCNNSSVPNCSQDEAAPTPWLYRSIGDSPTHRTRLVSRTMRNEPFAHLSLLTVPAEVPGELALPPLISQLPGGGHATHPSGKVAVASWHSLGRPEVLHGPFAKKTFVLQETDIARRHDGGRFSLLAL